MNITSKPSYTLITSILCGILIWVTFCIFALIALQSGVTDVGQMFSQELLNFLGFSFLLLSIVGSITGIIALKNKEIKRRFVIIGLSLNLLCLVPFLLILLVAYITANLR